MTDLKESGELKNKLIIGVDSQVWRQFVGFCMANNLRVGDAICGVISEFLKKEQKSRGGEGHE